MTIDPDILAILRCPKTMSPLALHEGYLVTTQATPPIRYPIRDGIPQLLIDEGQPADGATAAANAPDPATRPEAGR